MNGSIDVDALTVGARLMHRVKTGWIAITITGITANDFYYQRDSDGHGFSSARQEVRRPSRFRHLDARERGAVVEALPLAVRAVEREPRPGLVRLPVEVAAEPIVPAPEDLGVRVYVFHDRPCVIAAAVGKALGYADDGRSLTERVRGEWSAEFAVPRDVEVLEGEKLREFKAIPGLTTPSVVSRNTRSLTILYETGFDLVLQKTDKPEGQKLRRRLAEEVLPKLRRGQPVQPSPAPLPAPPSEMAEMRALLRETIAGLPALVASAVNAVIPQTIASAVAVLKPLMLLPGSAAEPPAPELPIPPGWLTHADMAERLPLTRDRIEKLIRSSDNIRSNTDLCRTKLVEKRDKPGSRFPCFYYHPSVLDLVKRLDRGAVGTLLDVDAGLVSNVGTDVRHDGHPAKP